MNYATDGDGRIVAAPSQEGPLANITCEERYELIDTEWELELSNAADSEKVPRLPRTRTTPRSTTAGSAWPCPTTDEESVS
ncbi:MAG TPA: hypothetical protein VIU15_41555 [Streptomyces sp.]